MTVPLDAIRAIHNAFRKDMTVIDTAAHIAARGRGSLDLVVKRYTFFNEVLVWHASGEEDSVFPALENVAPLVAEAYERDHRGLDSLFESLNKAVNASDTLAIARATAAFDFHLGIHLNKEDAHLYRIFNDYPLIGPDDREDMTRIWQQALPEPAFASVTKLIQAAIGNDWAELTRRIPELK